MIKYFNIFCTGLILCIGYNHIQEYNASVQGGPVCIAYCEESPKPPSKEYTPIEVVPPKEEPKEPINEICSYNKGLTYTEANNVDWDYDNLLYPISPNSVYMDELGFYREIGTGAYLGALGTRYSGKYYNIELSNGITFTLRNTDVKSDIHTDSSNCYTTADNSIVEMEMNSNGYYASIGNSLVKNISVKGIYEYL